MGDQKQIDGNQGIKPEIFSAFQSYFNERFTSFEKELSRFCRQTKEEDEFLKKQIDKLKDTISILKEKVFELQQKTNINTEGLKELEEYKKIVDDLHRDIKLIKDAIEAKQKNTLTIAIAIFGPIVTAALMWMLIKISGIMFSVPISP